MTQQLADFIVETKYEHLPNEVVHEAKRVLLDSVGCALAGAAVNKGSLSIELAKRLGGRPESSIIGTTDMVSCTNAAFANGELMNALDFEASLHVYPCVLPPAIALGESKSALGKELILATVLGREIASRIASGLNMTRYETSRLEGGRPARPAVYGYSANAFGSAASAGKMLKLTPDKMANALGIAGYNAPMQTAAQWQHSGTDSLVKYASAGWIAQVGTTAVLLAETGYTGDVSVFDGEYGFWNFAGSEEWRPEAVLRNLGREWHILNTRYKLYPCCGVINSPLHLFTTILDKNKLTADEIEETKVWMHPLCEMPLWRNREIANEVHAQFSVAYAFALAAYGICPGAEWQDPVNMKSPKIREFMEKVTVAVHPDYTKMASEPSGAPIARVEVVARDRVHSEERSPSANIEMGKEPRVKDSDLVEKFKHNASNILSDSKIEEVVKGIWGLEEMQNISLLVKGLAPAQGQSVAGKVQ